jgi:hypothetical protein
MNMLNSEELNHIVSKIDLKGFKATVSEKNETRGRKSKDIYNPYFYEFQDLSYGKNRNDLQQWVDDVLVGAGRLDTGNSKVSSELIFAILKGMPFLSTAEIKAWLNRKRSVLGGDVVDSDRYCRWLLAVSHSAIKSLDYHIERGAKLTTDRSDTFKFSNDLQQWRTERLKLDKNNSYFQTNAELVAKLRSAGLNEEEITSYLHRRNK